MELLEKISEDLELIKNEVAELREEIDSLRAVRPEYIKKLRKIEKRGKFTTYSSVAELRKEIENV